MNDMHPLFALKIKGPRGVSRYVLGHQPKSFEWRAKSEAAPVENGAGGFPIAGCCSSEWGRGSHRAGGASKLPASGVCPSGRIMQAIV
jgi:hypothetical protein